MEGAEKVLELRPARLGAVAPRALARKILRAAKVRGFAILHAPVFALSALPGLLRAARELDAVIALGLPDAAVGPAAFMDAVRSEAEGLGFAQPLLVQAGPLDVTRFGEVTLATEILRCIEAGVSIVSLELGELPSEEAARICRAVCQPIVARRLSLEINAPAEQGRASVELLHARLEALSVAALRPDLVRVTQPMFAFEESPREPWALDTALLRALAEVAHSYGAALGVELHGGTLSRIAPALRAAGVRKVELTGAFARIAAAPSAEQIEALSFGEALDAIEALGAVGSASRAQGAAD